MLYVQTSEPLFHSVAKGPKVVEFNDNEVFIADCGAMIPTPACRTLMTCNFDLDERRWCPYCRIAWKLKDSTPEPDTRSWWDRLVDRVFRRTNLAGA